MSLSESAKLVQIGFEPMTTGIVNPSIFNGLEHWLLGEIS